MGCVSGKGKKNAGVVVQPYDPATMTHPVPIPPNTTVTTTTVANPNPQSFIVPPQIVSQPNSMILQNSNVGVTPPLPPSAKPINFNSRSIHQSAVSSIPPPIPMPVAPLAISNASRRDYAPPSTLEPVGRQPIVVSQSEPIEIRGIIKENARNLQYVPVHINPMAGPAYDLNSNYAMEMTQVSGIQTFMDQKVL